MKERLTFQFEYEYLGVTILRNTLGSAIHLPLQECVYEFVVLCSPRLVGSADAVPSRPRVPSSSCAAVNEKRRMNKNWRNLL